MRIALITTELRPGGAERALTELAIRLDRSQFEPRVFVLASPPPKEQSQLVNSLEHASVDVDFLNCNSKWQLFTAIHRLRKLLVDFRPRIASSFLFHANVVTCRATQWDNSIRVVTGIRVAERQFWRNHLERMITASAAHHVCVSSDVAIFAQRYLGLAAEKISVIPNAIDGQRFAQVLRNAAAITGDECRDDSRDRTGTCRILFVGRLEAQKGADLLPDILHRCLKTRPALQLLIAGDGPLRKSLELDFAKLGLQDAVTFLGWRADIDHYMANADILLAPSRWEGMSNVLLEAMAAGTAVVCTDVEGVCDLFGGDSPRCVCRVNDVESLANNLVLLAADDNLRRQIAEHNQIRVSERFSFAKQIQAYEQLYQQLANV